MKASNISKGMIILFKGQPYQVLDKEFFKLGRGRGNLRTKLKNLKTAAIIRHNFNSEESVESVKLEDKKMQYLYKDTNGVFFMETTTFEQISLKEELVGKNINFLKEGETYQLVFWEDKPIAIKIPPKVELKVVKSEKEVKGNRVSGASKEVVLETGLKVKTPLFIKQGDKLIINTQTGEYVSRAQ